MSERPKKKCNKVHYASRKIAKKFMKQLNHDHGMKLQDVYYCAICISWHLTSMPKKDSRLIRKRKNPPFNFSQGPADGGQDS